MMQPAFSQQKLSDTPQIIAARTAVYQAVRKDTAWATGAIVDHIYFVKFDKLGRKLVENSLAPDGSAKNKLLYIYGEDGRIKEEITASVTTGGVDNIYQYYYDSQGRLNGKRRLDAERQVLIADTVIRNRAGQVVKKVTGDIRLTFRDGTHQKYKVVTDVIYDEAGRPVEVHEQNTLSVKSTKKPIVRSVEKQDTTGLRLYSEGAFKRFDAPRSKKVDYVYDEYGNWVRRTEYNGVNPEYIVVRTIKYAGEENDRMDLALIGKVKTVRQTSYVAVPKGPGSIDKGEKMGKFFTFHFDRSGRKTRLEHFSKTGVLQGITEYEYDADGNVSKEINRLSGGDVENVMEWKYNQAGQLRNKVLISPKGETLRKGVFRYDFEGNCVSEIWFAQGGEKISEFDYQYDPYGQQTVKQVLFAPEGTSDVDYEPVKRSWNSRGRVEEEWIGQSQNVRHYTYKYNVRGGILSGTEPGKDQPDVKYVYKFFNDEQGNWKKRVKFIDDTPVVYEEREYTYYN